MRVSASKAAEITGKSVKTIYAAIKAGRLSATQDSSGVKTIDTSELIRVYGELKSSNNTDVKSDSSKLQELEALVEKYKRNAEILLSSNKSLREQNSLLKEAVEDYRARDKELREQHKQTLAIFQRLLPKSNTNPNN